MADEEQAADDQQPAKGGKGKLIMMVVGALVLFAGGGFGLPMVMKMMNPPPEAQASADGATDAAAAIKEGDGPPLYYPVLPPLTANFSDDNGRRRFMQVGLEVMARKQSVIDDVKNHDAVIRNTLLLALGDADYDAATTREGKEAIRLKCLQEIRLVLEDLTGDPGVEAVYFTSFIIQ